MSPNVRNLPRWPLFLPLTLLWLSGACLRLTILAVTPVLSLVSGDLDMSVTAVGTLGSLPSLLFACASIPGALLIARLGAVRTLVIGLLLTAVAGAARGFAEGIPSLYLATIAMSAGIAIVQPAMPPLVQLWLPARIGFGTAVYTNGLLVAEVLAVALTLPLVMPLAGWNWRTGLVLWSLPVLATAVLVGLLAPRLGEPASPTAASRRWWPDWKNPLMWRLAVMLGGLHTMYFGTNSFLPGYLHFLGRPDLIGNALSALSGGQIPASLIMLVLAGKLVHQHMAYLATGLTLLASIVGILVMSGDWIVFWSGILGFAAAVGLILVMALPPLLDAPEDVHRLTAGMLTIAFPCAVVFPILGGFIWDATDIPALAFLPVALGGIAVIAPSFGLGFGRRR